MSPLLTALACVGMPALASVLLACSRPDVHDAVDMRAHACSDCHLSAYRAASAPVHVNLLATTCSDCHGTTAWAPATAGSHPWSPLTGAHLTTACAGCHRGTPPVFLGVPTACVDCHLAQYEASPYPSHGTFATTCADCHGTTTWSAATAGLHPEARFPIAAGPHSFSIACTDCHVDPAASPTKGANCDCVHCHLGAHELATIDATHASLGPAYTPAASGPPNSCLTCHPSG